MHKVADVEVAKNIMDANKRLADKNLKNLEDKEIFCVDFELGSHMRIVVVSVTEGDDTVEKHPLIFQTSDAVVINKIDLAEAVGADADKMVADAKKLNPNVKIIKSSLKDGSGLDEIIKAIAEKKDSL